MSLYFRQLIKFCICHDWFDYLLMGYNYYYKCDIVFTYSSSADSDKDDEVYSEVRAQCERLIGCPGGCNASALRMCILAFGVTSLPAQWEACTELGCSPPVHIHSACICHKEKDLPDKVPSGGLERQGDHSRKLQCTFCKLFPNVNRRACAVLFCRNKKADHKVVARMAHRTNRCNSVEQCAQIYKQMMGRRSSAISFCPPACKILPTAKRILCVKGICNSN